MEPGVSRSQGPAGGWNHMLGVSFSNCQVGKGFYFCYKKGNRSHTGLCLVKLQPKTSSSLKSFCLLKPFS